MKRLTLLLAAVVMVMSTILTGCGSKKPQYQNYSSVETVIIAPEGSGDYVLRVQGRGATKAKALENAKRQAVYDIVFKNLHMTYGDHKMVFAIVNNPKLEDTYSAFFNKFFDKGGRWKKYVGSTQEHKENSNNDLTYTVMVNVMVKRAKLKEYLHEEIDF